MRHREKLRFLAAGAITTGGTLLLYWALLPVLDARVAYAIAYASGIAISYSLNSLWVFGRDWTRIGLMSFALGYGVQAALSYGLFLGLLAWTPVPSWFVPVVVTLLMLPVTFAMNRCLVHRTSPPPAPPAESPR